MLPSIHTHTVNFDLTQDVKRKRVFVLPSVHTHTVNFDLTLDIFVQCRYLLCQDFEC